MAGWSDYVSETERGGEIPHLASTVVEKAGRAGTVDAMPVVPTSSARAENVQPDWKPPKRKRDRKVFKRLHARGGSCVLCGRGNSSLHHIYPRSQGGDDVGSNLVFLCGHGTSGHHGLIESGDVPARHELGAYVTDERPDIVFYMQDKLGEEEGREWLRQRLFMHL